MTSLNSMFEDICKEKFSFLEHDFGFAIEKIVSDNYGCFITYKNETTAIKVNCERAEILIEFFCLKDGVIPERPIFPNLRDEFIFFNFNDLLAVRGRGKIEQDHKLMSHRKYLKAKINEIAALLRENGADVLRGDFSILPQIKERVEMRSKGLIFE